MPLLLTLAHLVGGASGMLESMLLTATIALVGAGAFAAGKIGLDRNYWSDLRVPLFALAVLLVLGFGSVMPGSNQFAAGWIGELAGLETLSIDPEATWVELAKLLGLMVVFVLAYRHASTADRMTKTLRGLVWLTVGWALWALVLYAVSARSGDTVARLSGTFVSPNVAACVLAIGLLCLMAVVSRKSKARRRMVHTEVVTNVAAGLVLSGTLLLTASRSGIAIMIVLTVVWGSRRAWRWVAARSSLRGTRLLIIGASATFFAVLVYSASAFLTRLGGVQGEIDSRLTIMTTYATAASDSPFFGHGMGTVPRISRLLLTPENDGVMWNVRAVHNLPLQWMIETGVVGLLITLVGGGWLLLVTALRVKPTMRASLSPLFMVSAFMVAQGLIDYPAQIYSVALAWSFILGLSYRAANTWAGHDGSGADQSQRRCTETSPRTTKRDNEQGVR